MNISMQTLRGIAIVGVLLTHMQHNPSGSGFDIRQAIDIPCILLIFVITLFITYYGVKNTARFLPAKISKMIGF